MAPLARPHALQEGMPGDGVESPLHVGRADGAGRLQSFDVGAGYLLASKIVRHDWQRYWRTIAWVPNSEIIFVRSDPQKGQRGGGLGSSSGGSGTGRHEALLLQAAEHVEGALVDAAAFALAPAPGVPAVPVDAHLGWLDPQAFGDPGQQL